LLLALSLSTACAGTTVFVPRLSPAEINLASYKRLAVGGVSGPGGEAVVDDLTQALVGTQLFEVLDRKSLGAVLKEQQLSVSGLVSDETAVSVGNMIGAAALLVGEVNVYDYGENVVAEDQQCAKDGKLVPCKNYTRTANAKVTAGFKVMDTKTGKVLAAKTLQSNDQRVARATDVEPPPVNAKDETLAACRKRVVEDFMKVIAPYKISVEVHLKDDGDLPTLETGNNFAKIGNWASAIEQYRMALDKAEKTPDIKPKVKAKALYNLGIGLGYSGHYDDGVAELEKAYSLTPEDTIADQIARIKQFKLDDAKLAEQKKSANEAS
jgi:hypothetical protein